MAALYIGLLFLVKLIEDHLIERSLKKKSMFLQSDSEIENHVLCLVRLVDTIEKRKSRTWIEGYLSYHHRL